MKTRPISLMKFIPKLTPRFTEPTHLAPMVDVIERIRRGEEVECGISVPPRHEKTETLKHAIALLLLERPALRVGLVQYSQTAVEKRSREIRDLFIRAGGHVDAGASSRRDWRTGVEEGGLWATSPGGPVTGEGFDLIGIDDAVKDRATAESAVERDRLWWWWTDTMSTRREPGCSVIVTGTRWHTDDLPGRMISAGMEWITLPAIDGEGRALCPQRFNLQALEKIRTTLGQYGWSSLYLGEPFARGGAVFKDAHYCDPADIPSTVLISIGVDFAYSTRTRADYSVAVVLAYAEGKYHVLDVMHALSTETLDLEALPATADKFTRCQPAAAAWCAGKIMLPRQAPWLEAFVSEIVGFTGVGDRNDDQVDALAAAFDVFAEDEEPTWCSAMIAMRARETAEVEAARQANNPNPSGKCQCRPTLFGLDTRFDPALHICAGCGYARAS